MTSDLHVYTDVHVYTVMLIVVDCLLQLWLELARTFLALHQIGDAQYCVQQAKSRSPGSPAVHHMEGRVFQVSMQYLVSTLASPSPPGPSQ